MSSITQAVTEIAPSISSFGAGGQMYMASIWGGFNLLYAQSIYPLFAFNMNDNNVPNAAQLTNLVEARKVGSTMAFRADKLGVRVLWLDQENAPTSATANNMRELLASAFLTLTVGSNETRVGEFSGMDFMQAIDVNTSDTTATAATASGLGGGTSWVKLQVPIEIQQNVNIGGTVRFTRPVPAACQPTGDVPVCAFVVILQGLKVVKS